jgi:hypothetical protein
MSREVCKRCPYAGDDCQDARESGDCPEYYEEDED